VQRPDRAGQRRARSISVPAGANIGQINWPRYIEKLVSWPTVSSWRQTKYPPTPSVSVIAAVSVRPTAGS
jgi:hypothetical protein